MGRRVVCSAEWQKVLGLWIARENKGSYVPGRGQYIGLVDDLTADILAVCEYSDWNGVTVMMHCASGRKNWLSREFLWFSFYYPFVQLGVRKIISPVESGNEICRRFIEHIGFSLEATLKDCSPEGDLLLYTLSRENCRWPSLRNNHEQAESSPSA
jgi:RimJ/RimL family protein N-acetyltransferase